MRFSPDPHLSAHHFAVTLTEIEWTGACTTCDGKPSPFARCCVSGYSDGVDLQAVFRLERSNVHLPDPLEL